MPGLPVLNLFEPLATAMVTLLKQSLNTTIDQLNATTQDTTYQVPHAVQFLDYVPVPSTLEGGMPAVGVQELPSEFVDDLQSSADAVHRYAVVAILQNADHQTLTRQLRRMMQAIAATIQQDRLIFNAGDGSGGIMRTQGGAWSVNFEATVPGPLLGDLDPNNPEAPPRSYMSWCGLEMSSRRGEI